MSLSNEDKQIMIRLHLDKAHPGKDCHFCRDYPPFR